MWTSEILKKSPLQNLQHVAKTLQVLPETWNSLSAMHTLVRVVAQRGGATTTFFYLT